MTDIPPSNIKESIYRSSEGFILKYPSSWNKVLGLNRASFVSNHDNPQDHYLERVDIYHYERGDNLSFTKYGENDFIK